MVPDNPTYFMYTTVTTFILDQLNCIYGVHYMQAFIMRLSPVMVVVVTVVAVGGVMQPSKNS